MSSIAPRRMPRWAWVAMGLIALSLLLVVPFIGWIASLDDVPVHVVIDGVESFNGADIAAQAASHKLALAVVAMLVVWVALIAVPVALLFGLAALLMALLLGVGLPLLVTLLALLCLLSPLWLVLALAWWLWRRTSATPANIRA